MALSNSSISMLVKKVILLFLVFLFVGCDHLEIERLLGFDVAIVDSVRTSDPLMPQKAAFLQTNLTSFMVLDSLVLAYQFDGDYYLLAYSINSGEKILSLCQKGRGPSEFITPAFFSPNGQSVLLYDSATNEISEVNLSLSLRQNRTVIEKRVRINSGQKASTGLLSIWLLDESRVVAFNSGQGRDLLGTGLLHVPSYALYNYENGELMREIPIFKDIPENKRIKNQQYYIYNYSRTDCISPDKKTVFFAMTTSPVYGLLDLDTGMVKGFRLDHEPGSRKDKYVVCFSDVCTNGQYIFALYYGCPMEDALDSSSFLMVIDWNGALIKKIPLGASFGSCRVNGDTLFLSKRNEIITDLYSLTINQIIQ